ncbi:hypothetical protein LC613_00005, partial [Nostoc sphaeroides CHAB 2801]|uniref:hypothetical protein n=1 Tax=Nostoc sphaeroides TaxID=446679 RepID=UPI001E3D9F31
VCNTSTFIHCYFLPAPLLLYRPAVLIIYPIFMPFSIDTLTVAPTVIDSNWLPVVVYQQFYCFYN